MRIHALSCKEKCIYVACQMGFLEKLKGYDDDLALEFTINLRNPNEQEFVTTVRGLKMNLNESDINMITILPTRVHQEKESRHEEMSAKKPL